MFFIFRLFGEKREEDAKKASAFCIWGAIIFGICVSIILLVFKQQILKILGADKVTYSYASAYYIWISIGAAAIMFGMVPSNILRTEGLATKAMFGSILGSVVNIILDPVFIFVFKQGAAGAAIATVLGNIIAGIYYIYAMRKKAKRLSTSFKNSRVTTQMAGDENLGMRITGACLLMSFYYQMFLLLK